MRTAKPCLLILMALLAALLVSTANGDVIGVAELQRGTLSVRHYLGETVGVHPGREEGCDLCKQVKHLRAEGRITNGSIVLGALPADRLLALETELRKFGRWRKDPTDPFAPDREVVLTIIHRHYERARKKEIDDAERARKKEIDDAHRPYFEPTTAKLTEKGIEYLVSDPKATPGRLAGRTLFVRSDRDAPLLLAAIADCPAEVRPELLQVAAPWPHVTEARLRHATQILTIPSIKVESVADIFRLLHPKRGPPLELTALSVPPLPQEWKELSGPWLVDRAGLNGEQLKKLAGRLRGLAIKYGIQTPILVQGEHSRRRLASLPEKEKARLVIDDSSLKADTGDAGPLFLPWLLKLAATSMPDRKIYLLFGHDERKPDGALSRWTKLAEDNQFNGAHVIFCICNDSPRDLQKLADVALAHGALSVVVTTERIDIPAMGFAASSFMSLPLPEETTPVALWEACYKDALKRLDVCLALPTEAETVGAIRREFGDMGDYLLTSNKRVLNRKRIVKLRKALQEQPQLFGPLAHDQRRRGESRTLARK